MPKIQFDVLVPEHEAIDLAGRFTILTNRLVETGKLGSAIVTHDPDPALRDGVEDQLRQTYRDEHDDVEMDNAHVNRYTVDVEGAQGSINQLTMVLARLLTPQAELPKDPFLLEQELAYERPATYPWAVDILR